MKTTVKKLSETKLNKNVVIVRANLNVNLQNGEIKDESKIKNLIPTLQHLQAANCKVIILTHLGKSYAEYNDEYSLIPLRFAISKHLNKTIKFVSINNCENSIKYMEFGENLLLENLCFSSEEFSNDKNIQDEFISKIAQYADYYVDESFGVEQNLASTSILPTKLETLTGFNNEQEQSTKNELERLSKEGFVSIIGGKATTEKIKFLEQLIKKSEKILLAGLIGELFLKKDSSIKHLEKLAKEHNCELILPIDIVTTDYKTLNATDLKKDNNVGDIGPKTRKLFIEIIDTAKTIVMNGTLGKYEDEKLSAGTIEVFEMAALKSIKEAYKVAGGEDTTEAIENLKIKHKKFTHISNGISYLF